MIQMTEPQYDSLASVRWGVYTVLIAIAIGHMSGRLLAVNSVDLARLEKYRIKERIAEVRDDLIGRGLTGDELAERLAQRDAKIRESLQIQRPFLSSNDRSRWATVRALVERGTFEIDEIISDRRWDSIDIVQHEGRDGKLHRYSSKPPLLAVLIAGEYWLIRQVTDKTLETHPYELGRLILFTVNVIPSLAMFVLLACIVESLGTTTFGNVLVIGVATMGTLLTSFATVLNNHLPAAICVTITIWTWLRIVAAEQPKLRDYLLAGVASSFAAVCDLPALSLWAVVGGALLLRSFRMTCGGFLPGTILVAAAFFGTNYAAHDTWKPPYAFRHGDTPAENWYHFEYERNGRIVKSYWLSPKGIDRGEPWLGTYALHVLVGHHGIFSLSPIWLLSVAGIGIWLANREISNSDVAPGPDRVLKKWFALATLVITVTVLVFYIALRPQEDRNYGGMTNGFRWAFWLIPLWLTVMLPAADWLARSLAGRLTAGILLALSAVSVAYATWNPWSHPWLTVWMDYLGWIRF